MLLRWRSQAHGNPRVGRHDDGSDVVVDQRPLPDASERDPSGLRGLVGRPSLLAALTVLLVGVPTGDADPTGVQVDVDPADISALLLVGMVGLRALLGNDLRRLRDPVFAAPALMVVAALVSAAWSTDPVLSLVGVVRYAELFCLVPLAVVLAVKDRLDVVIVLGSVVALGAVEGAIGVVQSATGTGAGFQGETNRAIGTFGVESVLSMATVVSLAQVILIAVALRERGGPRTWAAVGALVLVAPLLLSLSRGALVATACVAAVMLLATGVLRALQIGVLGVAGVVLGLAVTAGLNPAASQEVGSVTERILSVGDVVTDPDSSVQDRYDLWGTAISIWEISPLTGVGIKQFPAYRDSHAPLGMSSGSDRHGGQLEPWRAAQPAQPVSPASQRTGNDRDGRLPDSAADSARAPRLPASRGPGTGDDASPAACAFGLLVWYALNTAYGDLAGSTAVLYAVLLGMQLRSATLRRLPLEVSVAAGRSP